MHKCRFRCQACFLLFWAEAKKLHKLVSLSCSVKRVSAIGVSMRWCRLDRHEQVPSSMPIMFSIIMCRFLATSATRQKKLNILSVTQLFRETRERHWFFNAVVPIISPWTSAEFNANHVFYYSGPIFWCSAHWLATSACLLPFSLALRPNAMQQCQHQLAEQLVNTSLGVVSFDWPSSSWTSAWRLWALTSRATREHHLSW